MCGYDNHFNFKENYQIFALQNSVRTPACSVGARTSASCQTIYLSDLQQQGVVLLPHLIRSKSALTVLQQKKKEKKKKSLSNTASYILMLHAPAQLCHVKATIQLHVEQPIQPHLNCKSVFYVATARLGWAPASANQLEKRTGFIRRHARWAQTVSQQRSSCFVVVMGGASITCLGPRSAPPGLSAAKRMCMHSLCLVRQL